MAEQAQPRHVMTLLSIHEFQNAVHDAAGNTCIPRQVMALNGRADGLKRCV